MSRDEKVVAFANRVLPDWESAIHRFFEEIDRKREDDGLTDDEVERALDIGYGSAVADAWRDWIGESDE